MSLYREQPSTDQLHFSRLLKGRAGTDASGTSYQAPEDVVYEYAPDYSKRVTGEFSRTDEMTPAWNRLCEYLLFDLSQVLPREEVERIEAGLTGDNFLGVGDMYVKVHEWAKAHPAEAEVYPMIQYVAVAPPTLGYWSVLFKQNRWRVYKARYLGFSFNPTVPIDREQKKKIVKLLKTVKGPVGEELRRRMQEQPDFFALNAAEDMAWSLAQGGIPSLSGAGREYREGVSFEHTTKAPEWQLERIIKDILATLPIVKVALGVRGKRWAEEAPEPVRVLTKELVELEWLLANPVLDEEGKKILRSVVAHEGAVMDIGQTEESYRQVLSWPMVLHKLLFDADRARELWMRQTDYPAAFLREADLWKDPSVKTKIGELLAPVFAEMLDIPLVGEPGDFVEKIVKDSIEIHGYGEKRLHLDTLVHQLNQFVAAKADPGHAKEYVSDERRAETADVTKQVGAVVKKWFWEKRLLPLPAALREAVSRSDAPERLARLSTGYFRNLCEYLRLEHAGSVSPATLVEAMDQMRSDLGEGALVSRAQDVMNEHVKQNYQRGTENDPQWKAAELFRRGLIDEATAADLARGQWGVTWPRLDYTKAHRARKAEYTRQAADFPSSRDLYLFSDLVRRDEKSEQMVDPLYKPRLLVQRFNPQLEDCAQRLQTGQDVAREIRDMKAEVTRLAPDKSGVRDYLLENIAHLELWIVLQTTSSSSRFAKEGIQLSLRTINLDDHFGTNDNGVLAEAYMKTYPVVRVEGLARALYVFSIDEKKLIADFLTDQSRAMTPATAELFERLAVELEIDHLRADYTRIRDRLVPAGSTVSSEDRVRAGDLAFEEILSHVLDRFPHATHHRDSILFALMTDLATTLPQTQRLEKLTYAYLVRHPLEGGGDSASPTFTASETVKNYLALFQNREMRGKVLVWFFGGEIPDDRFLEGSTFKINEQEKVEAFWALSQEERRAIFYAALLGEHGLFEVKSFDQGRGFEDKDFIPHPVYVEHGVVDMMEFLHQFYDVNFKSIFTDPKREQVFRIAFFEVFTRFSPARRVELFLAIAERLRELKRDRVELTVGNAIALLLEQGGVVGVKAGQVMSEQKDMVPGDVRSDLSSLKDRRAGFSKRGVFTYAQQGRLFEAVPGQPRIVEIGEMEGSASIKQVHRVVTDEGEELAYKVERPSIEKNYAEDVQVLQHVVNRLRSEGIFVPSWLVGEITRLVEAEMDFGREAANAEKLRTRLEQRQATLRVAGQEVPLKTPKVRMVITKSGRGRGRVQMMLEEFAPGLSLADISLLQELDKTKATDEKASRDRERLDRKLHRLAPGHERELRDRYAGVDVEEIQAGLAIEQLFEIAEDGTFHADMHDGNVIVNLAPGKESASLIDAGSAGVSGEKDRNVGSTFETATVDARTDFLDFGVNVLLLKSGIGDTERVAQVIGKYTNSDVGYWKNEVVKAVAAGATVGEVFKELLAEIMRVKDGETFDEDFRYVIKALASSGGHLEALKNKIMGHVMAALAGADSGSTGTSAGISILQAPEIQKLMPLLPRMPTLMGMIQALVPTSSVSTS